VSRKTNPIKVTAHKRLENAPERYDPFLFSVIFPIPKLQKKTATLPACYDSW